MQHSQLYPLQVNPLTKEPYLRLASLHENIIITPPRMSDVDAFVHHMNDRKVADWLKLPPYPYLPADGESWLKAIKDASDLILEELKRAQSEQPDGPLKIVGGCPVRILREIAEDGTETLIGDVGFRRCRFEFEGDEQSQLCAENAARVVEDPSVVWCLGDWLASSRHGRGIMTAAIGTLITVWGIPRMGIRRMRVEVYLENVASGRTFEKCGFLQRKVTDDVVTTKTGMARHGMRILRWEHA